MNILGIDIRWLLPLPGVRLWETFYLDEVALSIIDIIPFRLTNVVMRECPWAGPRRITRRQSVSSWNGVEEEKTEMMSHFGVMWQGEMVRMVS